ncbi:LOW QUALITY PROTEIN: hypothetical protein HID58_049002 [Brassica napus]|uniref:Uncharacterized protein n=1 Tax=Brassica napus TaxID=3708 RepID=A0ABQ8B3Q4_BRANA|nr:LOW QUALITY PROTEIN: hypothetical protein HID58_049002 [Brassica napus]
MRDCRKLCPCFSFENMKNIKFKEFRQQLKHNGSFFMVMMNCLLHICQRKRLKGIISLSQTFFPSCFGENNYERLKLYTYLLIISDKRLPGKKSLYIRVGCRGDWPNIKPPG